SKARYVLATFSTCSRHASLTQKSFRSSSPQSKAFRLGTSLPSKRASASSVVVTLLRPPALRAHHIRKKSSRRLKSTISLLGRAHVLQLSKQLLSFQSLERRRRFNRLGHRHNMAPVWWVCKLAALRQRATNTPTRL